MDERRQTTRHSVEVQVDLHSRDKRIPLRARDVSRHGLFVEARERPPLHHAVLLTVRLPGGPFETMATVTRHVIDDDERAQGAAPGMGVKLFCLGVDAKERWDRFVASLENPGVPLPVRALSSSSSGACFLVQPDDPQDLLLFFLRNVVGASQFYISPAVRELGARVDVVLVHPKTHAEHVLTARVAEWNADHPLRMGIRFDHVDRAARRAFQAFLGPVPGNTALGPFDPDDRFGGARSAEGPPLVENPRPHWTEYAYYSPKLRAQAAAAAPPAASPPLLLEEEVLDVLEGQLLELPQLDGIDKRALFDFAWRNDGAPED